MNHKQGLFYCLQSELRIFLSFFGRVSFTFHSLLQVSARIYKQVADLSDSLRGVAILTKIFLLAQIFNLGEVQS
jgi:hypothetical protein